MTSQVGKKKIAMLILPNVSSNKDKQGMKFDQLTEYNTRNIFLKKLLTKCGGKTIPRPFF